MICYGKLHICLKELGTIEETSAYLFYQDPSLAQGLAKDCQAQGIGCETWFIRKGEGLQAEGLSHVSDGYIVQAEGGRLGGMLLHAAEPPDCAGQRLQERPQGPVRLATGPDYAGQPLQERPQGSVRLAAGPDCSAAGPACMVSTQLARALFGSEGAAGKKVFCQGISYTIRDTIPYEMPILFLGGNTCPEQSGQARIRSPIPSVSQNVPTFHTEDGHHSLAITMVQGNESLDYHRTDNLVTGSDAKLDFPLIKWAAYLAVSLCSFGFLILLFTRENCMPKCISALCVLLWICYVKLRLFSSVGVFPFWALPGSWADLDGWGSLWDSIGAQFAAVSQFREYPILHRYFQLLAGWPFYLLLCFCSFWGFLKIFSNFMGTAE